MDLTNSKRPGPGDQGRRISLIFHHTSGKKEEQVVIFDSDATALPNGEPLIAKKWAERVNELLSHVKPSASFRVAI